MNDEPRETLDTERMLLDFVRGRDVECPLCGYNLRDLTKTTCPECEHPLELRVGVQKLNLLPFVMAIAPGIFSGACATVLSVLIVVNYIANAGQLVGVEWPIIGLAVFGLISGIVAVVIIIRRNKFLKRPRAHQRFIASLIWTIHLMALLLPPLLLLWG